MSELDRLLVQQEELFTSVSRTLVNFKKLGKAKWTGAAIRQRIETLKITFAECRTLNAEIRFITSDSQRASIPYFTSNLFARCEDTFNDALDFMADALEEVAPPVSPLNVGIQPALPASAPSRRLPRIPIPSFDGTQLNWEMFRDQFSALVIADPSVSNVERLHHLASALKGDARGILASLPLTDANFEIAWSRLTRRYDNKRKIVHAHLSTLFHLPAVAGEDAHALRQLHDQFRASTQALKNHGVRIEHWDGILVYMIVERLDRQSRRDWELLLGESPDIPSFSELDQYLTARIHALQQMPSQDAAPSPRTPPPRRGRPSCLVSAGPPSRCPTCPESHSLYLCPAFQALAPDKRRDFVVGSNRCFNCLASTHPASQCPSPFRCRVCRQKHHSLLHHAASPGARPSSSRSPSPPPVSNLHSWSSDGVLLATASVFVTARSGRLIPARALVDQGSAATLISSRLAKSLRLRAQPFAVTVTGLGGHASPVAAALRIQIRANRTPHPPFRTNALVLPTLTSYRPPRATASRLWPHVAELPLADPDPFSPEPIELIIGADLFGQLLLPGVRKGRAREPVAQETHLGWILSGITSDAEASDDTCTHLATVADELAPLIQRFWELEELPGPTALSPADRECEEHFARTHRRNETGRYVVRLPFSQHPRSALGSSRSAALHQLHRLEARFRRKPSFATAYAEFLAEYATLGHMTQVSSTDDRSQSSSPAYYIPHHAVVRPLSSPADIRVVFNASCPSTTGTSLNELLHAGPKLQLDLVDILLRWRRFRFVLSADIEKMYRQILVDDRDVDWQRILWRPHPESPVRSFRLRTVTYGTTAAPFLALRVLQQLAADEGQRYPLALPILQHATYVDDCLFGADDEGTAIQTRDQLRRLLSCGGFHLRKWAANSSQLLCGLADSDLRHTGAKPLPPDDELRVLGMAWSPGTDTFRFRLTSAPGGVVSKRAILSTIARIFDPLGLLTPATITAKVIVQQLWAARCDWDSSVPEPIRTRWLQFRSELPGLELIEVPRWSMLSLPHGSPELHGFADASMTAYAAAVYLLVRRPGQAPSVTLLLAKSKVAPLKTVSVPRLELCAAHLLTRLVGAVRSALPTAVPAVCWTDSTITLAWLSQAPTRWHTFVANRVSLIQTSAPDVTWRHVPTPDNPADCASRGVAPSSLRHHPLWWHGPAWLRGPPEQWPTPTYKLQPGLATEERRTVPVSVCHAAPVWDLHLRFSSWPRLLRVTALIRRFACCLRAARANRDSPKPGRRPATVLLTATEIAEARLYWLASVQRDVFRTEIHQLQSQGRVSAGSPLRSLCPFMGPDGLLRVRGRLQHAPMPGHCRHPVILRAHPIVTSLVRHLHQSLAHAGPQLMTTHLRQTLWLLRARHIVRSVFHACVPCARARAATATQLMGDLPACRVTPSSRAFGHTGVDYAGPLQVRLRAGRGRQSHKAYVAVFVCMASKAVHLELVHDYSSAAFLAAFTRFTARRGLPSDLYSDNGTTFQGADRELRAQFRRSARSADVHHRLATDGVRWHFIPPAAPHFGGLWEAAVKAMKTHLRRCTGASTLTIEEITTLLCRIEACLNSRPLTAVSDDLDSYRALTPGHLLIGTPLLAAPEPSLLNLNESRLSRWQLVQRQHELFWRSWQQDYLHTLQQRPKWSTRSALARVGQLVAVADPHAPPGHWALGRITECHPGQDGLPRVVTVRTAASTFKRPITKLCFLPVDIRTADDHGSGTAGGSGADQAVST